MKFNISALTQKISFLIELKNLSLSGEIGIAGRAMRETLKILCLDQGLVNFVKVQTVNILGFVVHMVSVTTTQLCRGARKLR